MPCRLRSFLAFLALTACAPEPASESLSQDFVSSGEGAVDAVDAPGSCLPDVTAEETRGLLALVNDEHTDAAALRAIGLGDKSATNIAAAKPFSSVEELDAVPWVGNWTCGRLRDEACDRRGLCELELSLWTWNIEHFPLSSSAVATVAATLKSEQVELVGFEEVDSLTAFDQLLEQLPGWEGIPGEHGFGTQVAVAYDTGRLQPSAVEHLFEDDSYRFPRPPLAVTFQVQGRSATSELTLVVVHLKAMVDAESQERRREAVITLEQWMYQKRKAGEGTIVAVGDYNDDIDDAPDNNVFQPFLSRPQSYAAWTLPAAERGEYSYIPFKRLIDHVIATTEASEKFPATAVETVPLETTIPSYTKTVSDHRPVRSRLVPIIPANPSN